MDVKLVVEVDEVLRHRAKMYALQHNSTLREFVACAIEEAIKNEIEIPNKN